MIPHPRVYTDPLAPEDAGRVLADAMRILDEVGIVIQSREACGLLSDAGATVEHDMERVRLSPDMVNRYLAKAPSHWTFHARNPQRNVEIGVDSLLVAPGYGSAFVADAGGTRRYATMDDFKNFALLAGHFDCVDITGGLLVEPSDVPVDLRPLELTYALASLSDKPFMGSVLGAKGAKASIEIAQIIMGDLTNKPSVLGLININSPLRLDGCMAEAMLEYVKAGQPIMLTPGILMGITAPVTAVGALAQAFAELIGCTVLAQVIRPAAPVILGIGGFGSDMRTGGSGFGHPENALGTLMGAQIARHLHIPYRCSAAVTNSTLPDCQSGYERMMTAICAWNGGANICLQAAGSLDSINSMCYEQFVIDMEIWAYIKRLATPLTVNDESLAFDVIASRPTDYLSHDHTVSHFKEELLSSSLMAAGSYENWQATGAMDVVARAGIKMEKVFRALSSNPLHNDIERQLAEYVASRRNETLSQSHRKDKGI